MTAARLTGAEARSTAPPLVSPVVDYEPPPVAGTPPPPFSAAPPPPFSAAPPPCPPPTPAALHRHTSRPLRPVATARHGAEPPPPRAAAVFADAALRRVLEVADRRRPVAALRPLLAAPLIDGVIAMSRTPPQKGTAVLRRVRVRSASIDPEATAAEVFGTFTRGTRVHAIAGRIEVLDGRWRVVALQVG